ncbi:hypothetical protein BCR33DRAFT_735786 [Rhizoclosmatium globosum]|uniref:Uncharacterized protein n=1 Tax=Rhizoclosmatium globosum TaxID=329046 RepID=A0A1Y2CMY6_9FUNG|nr:hypothetical protein BCR33DRAFT_735786 [Rhizoclosmatium globosum]|eukprot:ORY48327.1 hypothetical protein BCR33DRAFT_735786 [Rhizoclosmatium globosum]
MVTSLTSASISSLPTEIREKILQYLPIDVHLAHVGLASKALFAPSIFHSIEFARSHVTAEIIRRASGNVVAYIVAPNYGFRKGRHHCPHLPLQYEMILFRKALESENYSHRAIKHSICTPLVGCLRIKSVLAHLLKDPTFDPSCNSSRILMWTFYEGKEVSMQRAFETFKLLFEDGREDPTANNNEAFIMTCTYDHEEIVSLFLKNKSLDPSANSNEALKTACRLGNPNVTRCLLNDPLVDPTTVPDIILSTLQFGINRRCIPVLLKDPRIDPGFMNNAALAVAAFHDYLPAATLLLADPRVDPMDNKGRALINSVLLGRLNVFRLLYASPRVDFGR